MKNLITMFILGMMTVVVLQGCGRDGGNSANRLDKLSYQVKCDLKVYVNEAGSIETVPGEFEKMCTPNADGTKQPWRGAWRAQGAQCGFWEINGTFISNKNYELDFTGAAHVPCEE